MGVGVGVLVVEALVTGSVEGRSSVYTQQGEPLMFWLHVLLGGPGSILMLAVGVFSLWDRPSRVRLSGAMATRVERQLRPEPKASHPPNGRSGAP